jgi:glycosyltransferase involved in cell wall biosynthesis
LEATYAKPVWPPEPYSELAHAAWSMERVIADDRSYDVVHAHVPSALAFARMSSVPMVYTLHHDRNSALERYYQRFGHVSAVAISRRQREQHPNFTTVEVVHHGLDPARYPIGPGGPSVAFLGRIARDKGPHTAIDAARAAGLPIQLAGRPHWDDGDYFDAEIAPRLKLPQVSYLGEVGHVAKCKLLGEARALLFPIDWEEPFGLVLVEAMLCGTPVVAFNRGSVSEIINPGITGFFARDVADMAQLLHGPVGQIDRGRCRDHAAARFGRDRMVRDYVRTYERARMRQAEGKRLFAPTRH